MIRTGENIEFTGMGLKQSYNGVRVFLEEVNKQLLLPGPKVVHWNWVPFHEQAAGRRNLAVLREILLRVVGEQQEWVVCGLHNCHIRMDTY